MTRYFHVEYYRLDQPMHPDFPDHNAVVASFEEFAALADGRLAVITGEATEAAHVADVASREL